MEDNLRKLHRTPSVLFIYFLSGSWKVRNLVSAIFKGISFQDFSESLASNISLNILSGAQATPLGLWVIKWPGSLQLPIWITTILIELGSLIVIKYPRWIPAYGLILAIMHFGTGLVMDINYAPTVLAVLIVLVASFGKKSFFINT